MYAEKGFGGEMIWWRAGNSRLIGNSGVAGLFKLRRIIVLHF
jgi:hypothetical protein